MDMINTIDEITYELMIKIMSSGMTNFMLFMSHLGSAITLIVLTIAFILLLKNKTNSKFIAIKRAAAASEHGNCRGFGLKRGSFHLWDGTQKDQRPETLAGFCDYFIRVMALCRLVMRMLESALASSPSRDQLMG